MRYKIWIKIIPKLLSFLNLWLAFCFGDGSGLPSNCLLKIKWHEWKRINYWWLFTASILIDCKFLIILIIYLICFKPSALFVIDSCLTFLLRDNSPKIWRIKTEMHTIIVRRPIANDTNANYLLNTLKLIVQGLIIHAAVEYLRVIFFS